MRHHNALAQGEDIESLSIIVQGEAERLTLEIIGREQQDSMEYWGGNWLAVRFHAVAPGFQADFVDSIHLRELVELREHLAGMYAASESRWEWKATEGILELTAERDKRGRLSWTMELIYPISTGARLILHLTNDQTYLPLLLNQIDAVLAELPLRGQPR